MITDFMPNFFIFKSHISKSLEMKSIFILILVILTTTICSCGIQYQPLYIKTLTDGSSSITKVQDEYFEIELCSVGGHDYITNKELSMDPLRMIIIVDEAGEVARFMDSASFLNYMSERGYEMQDQIKKPYCTAYTFKRK